MCLRVVLFLLLVGCGKHLPTGTSLSSHPVQGQGTTAWEWVGIADRECPTGKAFQSQFDIHWLKEYSNDYWPDKLGQTEEGTIARIKYQLEFADRTETVADIELRHRKYFGQEGTPPNRSYASFDVFPAGAPADSDMNVGSAVSASAFYYFDLRLGFMDANGRYVQFGFQTWGGGVPHQPIHGSMIAAAGLFEPHGHCRLTWVDNRTN